MDNKKTLNLGLATLPIVAMLLLLIIGYGQFGLRIEPLLLVSAAIAAALAWWQGYRWDDIIEAIVAAGEGDAGDHDPDLRGRPDRHLDDQRHNSLHGVLGLKLISPQYILIAAFFITSVIRCAPAPRGGGRHRGRGADGRGRRSGRAAGRRGRGGGVRRLLRRQNFAVVRFDELRGYRCGYRSLQPYPASDVHDAAEFYPGRRGVPDRRPHRCGGQCGNARKVTEIVGALEGLYHFNLLLILPPVLVLWGAVTKRPVIPVMLAACALAIAIGVALQGFSLQQGLNALMDGFNLSMFATQGHNVEGSSPMCRAC